MSEEVAATRAIRATRAGTSADFAHSGFCEKQQQDIPKTTTGYYFFTVWLPYPWSHVLLAVEKLDVRARE